jgi:hypothetical protein
LPTTVPAALGVYVELENVRPVMTEGPGLIRMFAIPIDATVSNRRDTMGRQIIGIFRFR